METCALNTDETISKGKYISSLSLKNVNYGYIAAIILIFAIAMELKVKIPLLLSRLSRKEIEEESEESDYESMVLMETNV